jgi:hypothetical protein
MEIWTLNLDLTLNWLGTGRTEFEFCIFSTPELIFGLHIWGIPLDKIPKRQPYPVPHGLATPTIFGRRGDQHCQRCARYQRRARLLPWVQDPLTIWVATECVTYTLPEVVYWVNIHHSSFLNDNPMHVRELKNCTKSDSPCSGLVVTVKTTCPPAASALFHP